MSNFISDTVPLKNLLLKFASCSRAAREPAYLIQWFLLNVTKTRLFRLVYKFYIRVFMSHFLYTVCISTYLVYCMKSIMDLICIKLESLVFV